MSFVGKQAGVQTVKNSGNKKRYLEFSLGHERFAIPLLSVKEVIAVPETTKVPFTPDYFVGLMNLRGQVLSVIDLRSRLAITPSDNSAETAVIITDLGYTHLGLVVDSINRVIAIDGGEMAAPPEIEKNSRTEFVIGCYKAEHSLVLFIDVDRILDRDEKEMVTRASPMSKVS